MVPMQYFMFEKTVKTSHQRQYEAKSQDAQNSQ
jgi:hypothetical protein